MSTARPRVTVVRWIGALLALLLGVFLAIRLAHLGVWVSTVFHLWKPARVSPHYSAENPPRRTTWQSHATDQGLTSVFGTSDGKALWVVGLDGAILYSRDGEHWEVQTSPTRQNLLSVFGPGGGKSLWVVGAGGTILHSGDGEHWEAQTSPTKQALYSVFGTNDGKSLWAVGLGGTILHSRDGEHWEAQTSPKIQDLFSIFGTSDGKSIWATGWDGTILHSRGCLLFSGAGIGIAFWR